VADKVFSIDEGNIVEEISPEKIFSNPKEEQTKKLLKQVIEK